MSPDAQKLLEEARKLQPDDLDWLIQTLLEEGAHASEEEIEAAWSDEIKRRLDEIDSGAVKMIPLEDVLSDMDSHIAAKRRG